MAPKRILVVEDDRDILKILEYNLKKEGYEVTVSRTGEEGWRLVRERLPDLLVLDLMLPGMDGLEVCRLVRQDGHLKTLPILMLTAKSSVTDEVVGLEVGADDYVTKPFNMSVLLTRVKKLLQRSKIDSDGVSPSRHGILTLDPSKQKVHVKGREVILTALEFRLLHFLMKQPGRVFSRDALLDAVWKEGNFVVDRAVDVHVKSIRKKLGSAAALIETVRGTGYRLKEHPE